MGANQMQTGFPGGMCVGETTSQPASVKFVRSRRTNSARGRLYLSQKIGYADFLTYPNRPVI